jgi:tetratricopeptide (TPR) repeat protein
VVAVIAVRAFLLSGKDEVAPTPPDGTKPTPQDPSKLPVVPDPPPTPPDPTAKAPPAPSDEEVLRREEESKRREASATQVAAAKTLLDAGRTAEALAAFLKLRSDANFAAAPAAADGVRESVRAVLAAADAKRAAGDLDGAAADLESLRALAGTGPSPALTPADGYDPALVSSRAETIRREQVARALRRTDQLVAEGKYEDALRELRQVGMNPAIREESARAAGDVLRAALRRARERDQAGEHKAAIDDFDLVLREKAALAADSSMDVPSITLDLAEACLAAGEWRRSESALDSLAGDDATAPRAVVLRGKSGLAKNGGDEWPADRRDRMTALPAEAKGREADDQLARGERALDRGAFDTATLDARVALLLVPRSTRAKYVLGAAAAKRIAAGRRRAADLETARNQLRTVVSEAAKAPSPEIEKLRTSAEALLKALPKE